MSNSKKIKNDIERIEIRLEELSPEIEAQAEAYEKAQTAFACKKISFEELQQAQAQTSSIGQVAAGLRSTVERLRGEYSEALAVEARQAKILDLKETTERANGAYENYVSIRDQFQTYLAQLGTAKEALRSEQAIFSTQFRELVPGVESLRVVPKSLRDEVAKALADLSAAGVTKTDLDLIQAVNPDAPAGQFDHAIAAAERELTIYALQLNQAARDKKREEAAAAAGELRQAAENAFEQGQKEKARRQWGWKQQSASVS